MEMTEPTKERTFLPLRSLIALSLIVPGEQGPPRKLGKAKAHFASRSLSSHSFPLAPPRATISGSIDRPTRTHENVHM